MKEKILHLADRLSGFKTSSFLGELQKTQFLSYDDIRKLQWSKIRELLDFAYEKSAFYRERFKKIKLLPEDIKSEEDLKAIPILNKSDVKKIAASGPVRKRYFIQSSGIASGANSRVFLDLESAGRKFSIYLRHLLRCGWDFQTKIIYFLPHIYKNKIVDCRNGPMQAAATFIQNKICHQFITNREFLLYDNAAVAIDSKWLGILCKKINSSPKIILMGRADFFNMLILNLQNNDFRVNSPKAVINIGALLPDALRKRIESFFRCPVYDIYGCSEASYIAGTCRHNSGLHANEETHYFEIADQGRYNVSAARAGDIIITDLSNYSMPIIRYSIGDVGYQSDNDCSCGISSRILYVMGRAGSVVKINNGLQFTEKEICETVFSEDNVLKFHLRIMVNGKTELQLLKANGGINERRLREKLGMMGLDEVTINYNGSFLSLFPDKHRYVQ